MEDKNEYYFWIELMHNIVNSISSYIILINGERFELLAAKEDLSFDSIFLRKLANKLVVHNPNEFETLNLKNLFKTNKSGFLNSFKDKYLHYKAIIGNQNDILGYVLFVKNSNNPIFDNEKKSILLILDKIRSLIFSEKLFERFNKESFVGAENSTSKIEKERKQKEYTEFIETTLENLPIGIAVNKIDEGSATFMNNKFVEIYGWPKEILINVPTFFEKVYPDPVYREEIVSRILDDIQSKNPERMTWENITITTQRGEKRIVSAKNIPIYDQNLMISTVVDVTEKVGIQKSLEESIERYHLVTRATSEAIWDWDIEANSLDWGEGLYTLFGYDYKTQLISENTEFKMIHPLDFERVTVEIRNLINSDKSYWSGKYRLIKRNGEVAFVSCKAIIVRNEEGRAIRMVGSIQDITKQKREEEKLRLLESVVTNTNDAVLITEAEPLDEPGPKILYVNDAFTRMTGYTQEDVLGKNPRILQGSKSNKAELSKLSKALRSWQPCEVTLINYDKQGKEFWVNFAVAPVANEKGWYTHWISIQREVTNQKIEESKRNLLNDISVIFNETEDIQDTISKLLAHFSNTFDYPLLELWMVDDNENQLNLFSTFYPEDTPINVKEFYNNVKANNTRRKGQGVLGTVWEKGRHEIFSTTSHSKYLRLKEAKQAGVTKVSVIPVSYNNKVLSVLLIAENNGGKRFNNNILFSEDVSHHLGAEIKRKQLEHELSKIFNFSADIICIVNKKGGFKKINPAACNLLGYSEKELLEKTFYDLVGKEDITNVKSKLKKSKSSTQYFETRINTKIGVQKWFAWTYVFSNDGNGYVVGKDITERIESENQLKFLNDSLVKQSMELSISNKELEQFAYVASHDLQEPLRMVTSFLTLLEKRYFDVLDERGLKYINFAVEGAKNMRQIILDILNFSRINDNLESYEQVDLNEVIRDVSLLQGKLISDKNARLIYDELPKVYSIRHFLIQLFQNLISNSLKYSRENVPSRIVINSRDLKNFYEITVTDNGIGIEEQYYDKIFVIFQRLHGKNEYQGNGMGLAIVKKIVEKLNGKIWVESEVGKGTTFFIKLPKK